jgi:hypothetical protein
VAQLAARAVREPPAVEVMPENWGAVRVFVAMGTQWRRAGTAGLPVGLDYAALPPVAGALDVVVDADLLARLRLMETTASAALAERWGRR